MLWNIINAAEHERSAVPESFFKTTPTGNMNTNQVSNILDSIAFTPAPTDDSLLTTAVQVPAVLSTAPHIHSPTNHSDKTKALGPAVDYLQYLIYLESGEFSLI